MTLDGRYRGSLDRIEEGTGVVLVEDEGEVIEEVHVDESSLPEDADEGASLALTFEDGSLRTLIALPGETERRKGELQDRFDRLSERPPDREDEG